MYAYLLYYPDATIFIEAVNHEGPIVVVNVDCRGTEFRLARCRGVIGGYGCPNDNVIGLKCKPLPSKYYDHMMYV